MVGDDSVREYWTTILTVGSASTLKPSPYTHTPKEYEGHDLKLGGMDTIWSCGKTPDAAIRAFCEARLGTRRVKSIAWYSSEGTKYAWSMTFTCQGTSFKAAGIYVPGGTIMTWWK